MKKAALIVCLVLCCMLLTACYIERDPWPGISDGISQESTPAVPTTLPATQEPEPENTVDPLPDLNG